MSAMTVFHGVDSSLGSVGVRSCIGALVLLLLLLLLLLLGVGNVVNPCACIHCARFKRL